MIQPIYDVEIEPVYPFNWKLDDAFHSHSASSGEKSQHPYWALKPRNQAHNQSLY